MGIEVSAGELLRLRQFTQRIHPVASGSVTETVRHLLAIQAQDFAQALWAVGVRTEGSTRSDVLAALASGEVVRTLPMRGTLHFVAAQDLRWMLSLTAARSLQSAKTRNSRLGLDSSTLDLAESVTRRELAGRSMSRDEFMKLLAAHGVSTDGQRGYHVIFSLAQLGLVCWGPPSGMQQALVLVDDWIPPQQPLAKDAALAQFSRRYFSSHGPATERDFAWWTKLTLADVRAGMSAVSDELTELTHRGTSYWITTSQLDAATGGRAASAVHALPGFDEYLLGYQDRLLPLAVEHSARVVPGSNGIFLPTVVANGRVVGTWRRTPGSKTAEIEPNHFQTVSAAQLASFARAAKRYARFTRG
ncbi:MAG TPA: winged helix DNA-binding domain-containing protein [Galbitalea sp.]|nr:winged helix DNA-binding domain-containing protein [Galbitalea sp.]